MVVAVRVLSMDKFEIMFKMIKSDIDTLSVKMFIMKISLKNLPVENDSELC